jgi:SAM-dependent methyltransferase
MQEVDGKTLLDVGCGTGRGVRAALDMGYDAVGLDISPRLLEIAHKELAIPEHRLIQGDATNLTFPDRHFDVTCILGALHHSAQPLRIIEEMIRVTKKAMVISDEGNHLTGGIKQVLLRLGIKPVLMLFRRPPRTNRRAVDSEQDGPAFVFSIEEIIPTLKLHFPRFRCLTFIGLPQRRFSSSGFPDCSPARNIVVSRENDGAI